MTRLMVRLRDREVFEAIQLKTSAILGWKSIHQFNKSYQINEMEGLAEEVNKFHPLG